MSSICTGALLRLPSCQCVPALFKNLSLLSLSAAVSLQFRYSIANPVELAEKICGAHFSCIDRNGAGAEEREYCLVQPPKITGKDKSYYGQKSVVDTTVELLPEILNEGKSFIAFAKSRKNVEIILKSNPGQAGGCGLSRNRKQGPDLRLPGRLYAGGEKSHRRKNDLR